MNPAAALLRNAWRLAASPATRRFARALADPEPVQRALLARILRTHADTRFGREHGYARLTTAEAFRDAVPARDHADLRPWIDAAAGGAAAVLTPGRPTAFLPTSGTTSGSKLIPWTPALKREFNAALGPWITGFMRTCPAAWRGSAYWSLSPPAWPRTHTDGGIPVGFASDTSYLPAVLRPLLAGAFAVPAAVAGIRDPDVWRHTTLLHLLGATDLSLVSVWSPVFLTALLEPLARWWPALLRDLERGTLTPPDGARDGGPSSLRLRPNLRRAAELRGLGCAGAPPPPDAIWPRLAAISCWADASAREPARRLARLFPRAAILPKGLLATEGAVSIPWPDAPSPVLAVTSHFFEFVEPGGRTRFAWELEAGETYSVLITTGGGLARYALHDLVRVTGFCGRCPTLEFVGREGATSDLCGEKLAEPFVRRVLESLLCRAGRDWGFALLAPTTGAQPPSYTLFFASDDPPDPAHLALELESALHANPHYAHARRLAQLAPVRATRLPLSPDRAWTLYQQTLASSGQRLGDIKPAALSARDGWERAMFVGRISHSPRGEKLRSACGLPPLFPAESGP